MDLDGLKWDAAGLVTVVVQDRHTGAVRMLGHADREALGRTLQTGEGWFFSRSRGSLWRKGQTSGHTLAVHAVVADCDADAVLYLVDPHGPTCHTGRPSCFFQPLTPGVPTATAAPTLAHLWDELVARQASSADRSYTRSLLDAGPTRVAEKVREEAHELCRALTGEDEARVVSETADLLYHAMVGLLARGLTFRDVAVELARRTGISGHDEKASRPAR